MVESAPVAGDKTTSRAMTECLMAISKDRDKSAYAKLFGHFAPRIKAYLMRSGAAPGPAEDLAQETLLAVWHKADKFDPAKASASTWIYTIARNRRIDLFRRENHPEFDPNDPALVPDPERPADQVISENEAAFRLRTAIASLPGDQKAVIELSYYQDKSHGAIAEDLQVPLGTVKSRLRLALGRLRSALEPTLGATQ